MHAYEAWGERRLRALERPVGARAVGQRQRGARARARPARRAPALPVRARAAGSTSRARSRRSSRPIRAIPRALDPVGIDQTFTFWTVVPPQSVFRGIEELRPGARAHLRRTARMRERAYWEPRYPTRSEPASPAPSTTPSAACASALEQATRAAHAARRRAGRQLPLRRPRQLARRGARPARMRASASRPSRCASRTPSTTRPRIQRLMAAAPRQRAPRGGRLARATSPRVFPEVVSHTERPILRTAPAPLYPAVAARARARHQGRAHRRRRRRDVRRLRPLPRRQGPALLGAAARQSARRPRLLERLYPYLARSPVAQQAMARQFFGRNLDGHREPGFAHDTRWHTTGALKRLLSPRSLRHAAATRSPTLLADAAGARSHAGRRSRRTSTSRSARCSPATCSRRRATAC